MSYTLILRHILHIFSTCIHKFATTLFTFPNFSIILAKILGGRWLEFQIYVKLHSQDYLTANLPFFLLHCIAINVNIFSHETSKAHLKLKFTLVTLVWNGHINSDKCQPSIALCTTKDRSGFTGTSLQILIHGCTALTFVTSSGLTQVPTVLS